MASDEPARDHHQSSEEEEAEAPSPGSPTDSRQGESVSSREERKARRDNLKEANKRSFNDEVENKEKTKRRAKSKKDKAETSKEGSPPPVSSVSHGSTVIVCSEDGMVPLYRELDGQLVQAGWAPPSKKKPVLLAKNKNPVLSGPPPPLKSSNKRSFQDSNQFPSRSSLRDEISEHAEDQRFLARLYDGDSDAEDRDSDSGSEREEPRLRNPALKGLGLEGVMEHCLRRKKQTDAISSVETQIWLTARVDDQYQESECNVNLPPGKINITTLRSLYGKEEAFKAPPLPYVFRREDVRAKDKLMVEQQTLAGLLGAATAGASIKLGECMTSLEMAAKSPDLPDSVRERIEAALDTLETGVCRRLGHALKIAAASFNDLSEKRRAAAVASTWKGTTLEAKINHDHPASLGQLFRGDVEATALEFADRNRRLDSLLHLKHERSSGSGHGSPMMRPASSRPPQQGQGFKSQGNFPAQGGDKKRKRGSRGNKHNKRQKGNQGNQRASGQP